MLGRRYHGELVQRRAGPHRGAWLGPHRVGFASLLWRARHIGPQIGIAVAPSGDRELSGEADVLVDRSCRGLVRDRREQAKAPAAVGAAEDVRAKREPNDFRYLA